MSANPNGAEDPVELVRGTVERACARPGIEVTRLTALVIGSPGLVDPRTGDPRLAVNLPAWHEGALDALKDAWHKPVVIENDVNLAAMAERADGAAAAADDFVLVWLGVGLGLATILDGRLHRGTVGVASVCVVLDPGLVVLGGEVGRAGGTALADRVAAAVASIWPSRPRVVPTGVPGEPVLRGAILAAVSQARAALLASVADPQ